MLAKRPTGRVGAVLDPAKGQLDFAAGGIREGGVSQMMREFSTRVLVSIIRAPYQNLEVMAWVMGVKNRRLNWCQQPFFL